MAALLVFGAVALAAWAVIRARARDTALDAAPSAETRARWVRDIVGSEENVADAVLDSIQRQGPQIRAVDTRGTVDVGQAREPIRRTRVGRRSSSIEAPNGRLSRLYTVEYSNGERMQYYAFLPTGIPTGTRPSTAVTRLGEGVAIWERPSGTRIAFGGRELDRRNRPTGRVSVFPSFAAAEIALRAQEGFA